MQWQSAAGFAKATPCQGSSGQLFLTRRHGDAESTEVTPVSLKINRKAVEAKPGRDGYVHLKRSWTAGDEVTLDLPMLVCRVHAHEKGPMTVWIPESSAQ